MSKSHRRRWGWGLLFILLVGAHPRVAQAVSPAAAERTAREIDAAWVDALSGRIERLLPVLMSSLAAARRAREPALIRCFDRAVSALHGVGRQLEYHVARWQDERSSYGERRRHARALQLLSARVEELAQSPQACFTGGVPLRSDETRVEIERAK